MVAIVHFNVSKYVKLNKTQNIASYKDKMVKNYINLPHCICYSWSN